MKCIVAKFTVRNSAVPWSHLPTQNSSRIEFQMVNLINFTMECTKLKSESIQIDCLDAPVNSRVSIHFVLLVLD